MKIQTKYMMAGVCCSLPMIVLLIVLFISGCSLSYNGDQQYMKGYQHGQEDAYMSASNKYYFYACYLQKNGYDICDTHASSDYDDSSFEKMLDKNIMVYKKSKPAVEDHKEIISLLEKKNRTKSENKKLADFLAGNLTDKIKMDKILEQAWGNK